MAREQTFLERIGNLSGGRAGHHEPTTAEDFDALMESVRQNVVRLLNARHGMSEALPDYGLPSLVDLTVGTGDHVRRLREAIQATLRYEPRLRRVRVTQAGEEDEERKQTPAFRIEAILVGRTGQHRVWYETEIEEAGRFNVSG